MPSIFYQKEGAVFLKMKNSSFYFVLARKQFRQLVGVCRQNNGRMMEGIIRLNGPAAKRENGWPSACFLVSGTSDQLRAGNLLLGFGGGSRESISLVGLGNAQGLRGIGGLPNKL